MATVIAGKLDDKELRESISKLVDDINGEFKRAEEGMTGHLKAMQGALDTFRATANSTATDIKNTFGAMGTTFDNFAKAMAKAAQAAANAGGVGSGGSGGSSGGNQYGPNTLGELDKLIDAEKRRRKEMELGTQELRDQNNLLAELQQRRKRETTDDATKAKQKLEEAFSLPNRQLADAEARLRELQRLASTYQGTGLLSTKDWNRLQNEIQKTQEKIERLKKTAAGQNLTVGGVLGMSEKTLDEIARKMQAIRQVQQGLDYRTQSVEMNRLNTEYARLQRLQTELLGGNQRLTQSNNALDRSFRYIQNRLAFMLTIGALTNFVKQIYEVRGQYELLERSLGVLTNSFERGSQIFQELSAMAIQSPFTLIELAGAAKQLTAYNFTAKEVVQTTRRLADISAALGVPMERLVYNLGQIRAQTVLTARDARDFANAGLPIVKSLADHYSELQGRVVSTGEVYDMMSKKLVPYADVMAVINKMTDEGGKFFNFQAKQASTLRVQLANLNLAWNNMLNEMGSANQGLLTAPITALKAIFGAWREINQTLTAVIISLGVFKGAQVLANVAIGNGTLALVNNVKAKINARYADYALALSSQRLTQDQARYLLVLDSSNNSLAAALVRLNLLTAAEARQIMSLNGLARGWKLLGLTGKMALQGLVTGFKMLTAALITAWPILLLTAIIDAFMHFNQVAEKNAELNKSISESAKEATDSLSKFLSAQDKVAARASATEGKLSNEEAIKVWETLRQELENSSAASDVFISKLLEEEDINERIVKGFTLAESIRDTTAALSDMFAEMSVNQDSWLWGAFGEGLEEDIQDYNEFLQDVAEIQEMTAKRDRTLSEAFGFAATAYSSMFSEMLGDSKQEMLDEIDDFATKAERVIRYKLGEEGVKDVNKVTEAVARIIKETEQAYPAIQGQGKLIFEATIEKNMREAFGKGFDDTNALFKRFLEILKGDSSSAFSGMTRDIISETGKWSEAQLGAIEKAKNKLKDEVPQALSEAIDRMLAEVNSRDIRIRISADFGIAEYTKFQQDFVDRINKKFGVTRGAGYLKMMPTEKDDLTSITKSWQADLNKFNESLAVYSRDSSNYAKEETARLKGEIAMRKDLLDLYNQPYTKKTGGGKGGGAKKDPLGDALAKEVQLIGELRKQYVDYQKAGVDSQTALTLSAKEFNKTLMRQNAILAKFGIKGLLGEDLANMDLRSVREHYESMLTIAQRLGNAKGVEALEKAIANINKEITKLDYKKITDGLNNELNKLKDEYELSLELDANPELGDMFTDMFGINTEALPKTFSEMYDKANEIARKRLKELKVDAEDFDLMSAYIVGDKDGKWKSLDMESTPVKDLLKWQKTFRDMFTKNLLAAEKDLDDYVKKYGNYADKVAEIEANRLSKIKVLNNAYYTEAMRQSAEYQAKLDAINSGAQKETSNVRFEDFKNSQFYVTMFENLDYVSSATIRNIIDRLEDMRYGLNSLSPEQLKQVVEQIEKLEAKLKERNPYKGLVASTKDFIKALKERGRVEKELEQAQSRYDADMAKLADLETKLENAKSSGNKEAEKSLQKQVTSQREAVKASKVLLDNAKSAADRIKNAFKDFGESIKGIANKLKTWSKDIQSIRDKLSDVGIDLGEGFNMAIDGFAQATEGLSELVQSALKLDVSGLLVGVTDLVIGPFKMLQGLFGGFKKDYFTPLKESLEPLLDTLSKVATYQMKLLENMSGGHAVKKYRELIANNDKVIESYRELAYAAGRSNASWTTHSYAYRTNKRLSDDWYRISRFAGRTVRKVEDLYKLSPQELKEVMMGAPDAWSKIEKDIREQLEKIIEAGDNAVEYTEKLGEALTAISFDSVDDDFENMLRDMDNGASDFADNFENYLRNAIIRSMMTNAFSDRLAKWYEHFKKAMEDDELSPEEAAALRTEYMGIVNDALKKRDAALEIVGDSVKSGDLSALQQGIQGITEETASALEAYMNGVSQQVYLQSDLLTQIRDVIVGMDVDAQTATTAQILLQLQASYQVQMSIQTILSGWSNASGLAVRVEMV